MDTKHTKTLDGVAVDLKQKQVTRYVEHLTGVLASTSVPTNTRRTPRSPWIPFPMLLEAIRNILPPNIMFQIIHHYKQFMSKKISRDDFVGHLRLIVGDNLMRYIITNIKLKGPSWPIKQLKHQAKVKLWNEEAEISHLELTIINMKL